MNDAEFRQAERDWYSLVEKITEKLMEIDETIPELPVKDVVGLLKLVAPTHLADKEHDTSRSFVSIETSGVIVKSINFSAALTSSAGLRMIPHRTR